MSRDTRTPYDVTKRRALAAYREFMQEHGVAPSNAQIGRMLNMHDTYISRIMSELEDDGLLKRDKGRVTHITGSYRAKMKRVAEQARKALERQA